MDFKLHKASHSAEAENYLKLILQSTSDGIHGIDVDGRIIFENDAASAMFGWEINELIGKHAHELIHHHYADGRVYPAQECPIYKTLKDGETRRIENEVFFRRDGSSFPVEYSCSPLRDDAGEIKGAVVCFHDVTDRVQLEEARKRLLEHEREARRKADEVSQYYRALFESAPGCYLVLTPDDYQIVAVSEAYLKATMTRREAIYDKYIFEMFPDNPNDPYADGVQNLKASLERVKKYQRIDVIPVQRYPIRRPESEGGGFEERYWVPVNSPVFGTEGELIYIIHRVEDVTDYIKRKQKLGEALTDVAIHESRELQMEADIVLRSKELQRLNEELRASEERFRCAFHDAATGMAVTNLEGQYLLVNQAYCEMLGYSEKELLELNFPALTHPDDRPRNMELIQEIVDNQRDSFVLEKRYIAKSGNIVWVRISVSAQRDDAGQPVAIIGVVEDITEHKLVEENLQRNELMLRIATSIGHIGAWSVELPSMEIIWSDEVCDIHEMPHGYQPTLDTALSFYPSEHLETIKDAFFACVERGEPFDLELQILTKSNRLVWVRTIGEAIYNQDGDIVSVQGAFQDISKPKAAEFKHHKLEDQLVRTLEHMSDAFFTLDRNWCFQYINGEFEKVVCVPRKQLLGKHVWEQFPTAVDSAFKREYEKALETNQPTYFEELYKPLNIWLGVHAYPSDDGLAVYFRNITDKRIAHDRLIESEERFRLLSKATNDVIWDWNLVTNDIWWNDGIEELFGYNRDDVESTIESWTNRIHPDDLNPIVSQVHAAIDRGDESWSGEYRFRRKDGTYAYVLDRGYVIRDSAGNAVRMVGGMTDLTERKTIELRLAEQAALLDEASDAILVRDLENRVIYWNRRSMELYGWSEEEAKGKLISELIYENPDDFYTVTRMVFEHGSWNGELEQRTKAGKKITVFCRWTLLRDEQGEPRSILALNTDISEQKRIEQQVLRNQRMESIGTLASGIAHDLNNILSPILMSINLLKGKIQDKELLSIIDLLEGGAQRGANLVRQILGVARGMEGELVHVNLKTVAEDIRRIVQDTFPRNIELKLCIPEELWSIKCDPTQIHQILMNMCINARDAMPDGGCLTITMKNVNLDEVITSLSAKFKPGPHILIHIEDTGVGMTPEVQQKIFEPFFTTKEFGKGTGLGLSTTFTIVNKLGGYINVYSEPGKGTKFKIYLPAVTSSEIDEAVTHTQTDLPRGNGEWVLVVDDEANIRHIVRKVLERSHYQVIEACDGMEGVAVYAEHKDKISVVLTDMSMPVMDGPSMVVEIKTINPEVKVIGSSGLAGDDNVAKVKNSGVKHFVPKPYTAETLLTTLRRIIDDVLYQHPKVSQVEKRVKESSKSINSSDVKPDARSQKILLVEDEPMLAQLANHILTEAGYQLEIAESAEKALELLANDQDAVELVLTDINLPGRSGVELFQDASKKYPNLKFVFVSGDGYPPDYLVNTLSTNLRILYKPYSFQDLLAVVNETIKMRFPID